MAFFSGNIINRIYELEKIIYNAERRLSEISQVNSEIANKITAAYENAGRSEVKKLLKEMDVEILNRNKDGIRVSALKSAGYNTIDKLVGMSTQDIEKINGIGEETAFKIVYNVEQIYQSVVKDVFVKLSYDSRNPYTDRVVQGTYAALKAGDLGKRASDLKESTYSDFRKILAAFMKNTPTLKWLMLPGYKKAEIENQLDTFSNYIKNTYSQNVAKLDKEYSQLVNGNIEECWKDFNNNSAPYYAYLENSLKINTTENSSKYEFSPEMMASIEAVELDLSLMKSTLRRYQEFGTKYIIHQKKSLLGDEMGLGKTIQAVAAIAHLKQQGKKKFLVVCPLSVLVNWVREIEKHTTFKAMDIHGMDRNEEFEKWLSGEDIGVTTFETLAKLDLNTIDSFDMIVVDEAHYVKNPEAVRTVNVRKLVDKAEFALYMTGTPLENKVDEMKFLIESLQPSVAAALEDLDTLAHAKEFRKKIAPAYLRRVREDVLKELPELVETEEWLIMNEEEQNKYIETLQSDNFMSVRRVSWNVAESGKSSKQDRLLEICDNAMEEGRKVLVFSFFRDTLKTVEKIAGNRCVGVITGDINSDARQALVDKFVEAPAGSILVSQIEAGGVGLNIQAASVVIFCEPQFKPSTENQAIARSYRMGQSRSVMVHRLLMTNSVDEKIMEMLDEKSEIFKHFADESVVGSTDLKLNESSAMKSIIESEKKRLGIDDVNK